MKLKNKKTGEIVDWSYITFRDISPNSKMERCFASISKLNEEWEDYKEPKKHYWIIDDDGVLVCRTVSDFTNEEMCKQIGNYFETKEEAEKAVEKLKAWKRLKDKGFRFMPEFSRIEEGDNERGNLMFIACTMNDDKDFIYGDNKDLELLFGGEE